LLSNFFKVYHGTAGKKMNLFPLIQKKIRSFFFSTLPLSLLICAVSVCLNPLLHLSEICKTAPVQSGISFLNDRSAAIIGAEPLATRDFVCPEGLTGKGQIIALADSGLGNGQMNNPHPDLKSQTGQYPKVVMLKSYTDRKETDDPNGHGTHMASTAAGTGAASNGKYRGIAPEASIYFQCILNSEGEASPPLNIDRLFQPAYDASARIHINGWGGKNNAYLYSASQIDAYIRKHPDFLVIFGAGNDGPNSGTLTQQANSKNSLVIGASEGARPAFGPGEDNATQLASFSSRGPTSDGRLKPDLVAPGSGIISAAAPLIKSNFITNTAYTKMQGTSMAAAVAGGAAALLREFFLKEFNLRYPSAALMKAALVNGAQPLPDNTGAGFGKLDICNTVLALKEKSFLFDDEQNPLRQGQVRTYDYTVTDEGEPFVATLAWTDPEAVPGAAAALVNDLDLTVTGPDGEVCFGNDSFNKGYKGLKDNKNNIEQVFVSAPKPGIYKIEVKASKLTREIKARKAPAQDFSIVYGQPLKTDIVDQINQKSNTITLVSGEKIPIPAAGKISLGGPDLTQWSPQNIYPGENAYLGLQENHLYLSGIIWRNKSTEPLTLSSGTLWLEMNASKQEGGYYLHPGSIISVNGQKTTNLNSIPGGVEVFASVNPTSQTIWWIKTDYFTKEGILNEIDTDKKQVYIFKQQQPYLLADDVFFSFTDSMVKGSREDLPFGAPALRNLEQLAPGMSVRLIGAPSDGKVGYIAANRSLVTGQCQYIDPVNDELILLGGKKYQVIDNAPVTIDNKPSNFSELKPGYHLTLVMADQTVISVIANSLVCYGKIVFYSDLENRLYILDYQNHLRTFNHSEQIQVFRWQQASSLNSLLPGEYVRLALDSTGQSVYRLDAADTLKEEKGTLSSFNRDTGLTEFSPGDQAFISSRTMVIKNGYPVMMNDVLPGEQVTYTLLKVPKSDDSIISCLKATTENKPPRLQISCQREGKNINLSGSTNGDCVYFYLGLEKSIEILPESDGRFSISLSQPDVKSVQAVAVDRLSGGVAGMYINVPEFFNDISGNTFEKEITSLASKGLLTGYPDKSYKPGKNVTRGEYIAMLIRLIGLTETEQTPDTRASSWAKQTLNIALQYKLISGGLPDLDLYISQPLSLKEAESLLTTALKKNKDRFNLDAQGIDSLVAGFSESLLEKNAPQNYITRCEAAYLIWQTAKLLKN